MTTTAPMATHFFPLPFCPARACCNFCCIRISWGGGGGGAAERWDSDWPMESFGWPGLAAASDAWGGASGLGGTTNWPWQVGH